MRNLARTSLGLLGLALIAPGIVEAQNASPSYPSGYQTLSPARPAPAPAPAPSPSAMPAPVGLDGQPMPAPVAEAPHKHKGRTLCAACAAKLQARNTMPPGTIVGCEHSKNGVCPSCQAALNMPGQFVTAGDQPAAAPAQPAEAPGRAVASSGLPAGRQAQPYDSGMSEPAPVGVVQANFSQGGSMKAPAGYPAQSMGMGGQPMTAPGRAVAESNIGHDPYQAKAPSFPRPHILGHLFGWSGIGSEKAQARAFKKAEAHAMITYDENGTAPVDEIPASMVFGKKR